ncbi:MAG: FHA domain-containing protein [Chloroflexota bacterium]|nr:FHA domain-containing protein [Chloroflexota bacterium]
MAIVKTLQISKDAESIVVYLGSTRTAMKRHKLAIREACQLSETNRAERTFKELIDVQLVVDCGDGILELTPAGKQEAQRLQKLTQPAMNSTIITNHVEGIQGGSVVMAGTQDIFATPLSYEALLQSPATGPLPSVPVRSNKDEEREIERTLNRIAPEVPTLDQHPLRNGKPETPAIRGAKPVSAKATAVRYLLAFDMPKDGLPIPVVNGDVLGRSKKGTIGIKHDEYISNRHCKFEIARDKATNRPALFVEDLGSRNGTFVDELEVYDGKVQLTHGSRLRVGNTVLIVVEIPY